MHKHRANTERTVGWTQCIAAGGCSGAAHGGVTHIDTCMCGAERRTESNGRHERSGRWLMPRCDGCGRHHAAGVAC